MTENKADFFHLCISYMSMVSYVYKSYVSLEAIKMIFLFRQNYVTGSYYSTSSLMLSFCANTACL